MVGYYLHFIEPGLVEATNFCPLVSEICGSSLKAVDTSLQADSEDDLAPSWHF